MWKIRPLNVTTSNGWHKTTIVVNVPESYVEEFKYYDWDLATFSASQPRPHVVHTIGGPPMVTHRRSRSTTLTINGTSRPDPNPILYPLDQAEG